MTVLCLDCYRRLFSQTYRLLRPLSVQDPQLLPKVNISSTRTNHWANRRLQKQQSRKMTSKANSPKSRPVAVPQPSASVLLVSPTNEILLLARVKSSSTFASAHVFPGGNLSSFHDGDIPDEQHPARHEDGESYRLAAIRETFEESGILLAKNNGFGRLIEVPDSEREEGRKKVHQNGVEFQKWLAGRGGRADTDALISFTRWITPSNLPRRFTTQMYLYFLPLASDNNAKYGPLSSERETMIPNPTSDGGIEHTTAKFLPPSEWLSLADQDQIILFPPQYFLLYLVSQFLKSSSGSTSTEQMKEQRQALREFVKTGDPPWTEKVMSPKPKLFSKADGRAILAIDKPGPELEGTRRRGDDKYAVVAHMPKNGSPRKVQVRIKDEVLAEERQRQENL